jgi:hypothetical protein
MSSITERNTALNALLHTTGTKLSNIHTYMPFHFINPSKPLRFGYETCPQDLTNAIRRTQIKTYKTKTKLRGLSPRANYTDRAAAAGRRS